MFVCGWLSESQCASVLSTIRVKVGATRGHTLAQAVTLWCTEPTCSAHCTTPLRIAWRLQASRAHLCEHNAQSSTCTHDRLDDHKCCICWWCWRPAKVAAASRSVRTHTSSANCASDQMDTVHAAEAFSAVSSGCPSKALGASAVDWRASKQASWRWQAMTSATMTLSLLGENPLTLAHLCFLPPRVISALHSRFLPTTTTIIRRPTALSPSVLTCDFAQTKTHARAFELLPSARGA